MKGNNKILVLAEVMKHFCVESRLTVLLWIIGDFDDAMTHKALVLDFRNFIKESVRANYHPLILILSVSKQLQTDDIYERYIKKKKTTAKTLALTNTLHSRNAFSFI